MGHVSHVRLFSMLETLRTCDDEYLELNTEDILEALFRSTIHCVSYSHQS
jgi:hypothetical protein